MILAIGFIGLIITAMAVMICRNSLNSTIEPKLLSPDDYMYLHDKQVIFLEPNVLRISKCWNNIENYMLSHSVKIEQVLGIINNIDYYNYTVAIDICYNPDFNVSCRYMNYAIKHPNCPPAIKLWAAHDGFAGMSLTEFMEHTNETD